MKSIEQEIATWINGRPDWQRVLGARILSGEAVDGEYVASIASCLVKGESLSEVKQITASDLPTASSAGESVALSGISDLANVNALASEASIEFAESGLTVIYGDNGSGKSGFARLVKEAVGARHEQPILPNAFDEDAPTEQGAKIGYWVGQEARELSWPHGKDPILRKVHFYDEACGDHYLTSDSELSYRPSALNFLDRLIAATEFLQLAIDAELDKVETRPYQVPGLDPSSSASVFMGSFDADTTDEQLDLACEVQEKAEVELADLIRKESQLLASNPVKEKTRLNSLADSLDLVQQHLQGLEEIVSPGAAKAIEKQQTSAIAARAAAELASKVDFKEEPLSGVGSETWRTLWSAAELYAQHEAYHDKDEFPYLGVGARCPLCHQELDEIASERLGRFRDFVRDQTEKTASEKEVEYTASANTLDGLAVVTVPVTSALVKIEAEDEKLAEQLHAELEIAGNAKTRVQERLAHKTTEAPLDFPTADWVMLTQKAEHFRGIAAKTDETEFTKKSTGATKSKNELKDKISLNKHLAGLKKEASRLRAVRDIKKLRGMISTGPASKQAAALARSHVSGEVLGKFAEESQLLGLNRVMLSDKGGDKGKLKLKPGLVGAAFATKTVREVLSEGEQTALGLAGLLTEMHFDGSNSALVLDDPITSLDHGRREKVARRIASIAHQRQVVVFTHDLTFLGDLIRAANENGVALTERSIVRHRDGVPGRVLEVHPWKAKDARKRIGDLREELAKLNKEESSLNGEDYQDRVQLWAGRLSETWERIVRNDIVGKVVERGTTEVRPRMVRLLAQITATDNSDFQNGYAQVSKWAPRHDKSEEVNFIAPTIAEMEVELDRVDAWSKRINSYAASS